MEKTIVVKLGGSTLGGNSATGVPDTTLSDLLKLAEEGWQLVIVHGGGNAINGLLKKLGEEPRFLNGLRITDKAALDAALMMMRGQINAELTASINRAGIGKIKAVGMSGVDGRILECRRDTSHGDLGMVGEIVKVNLGPLEALLKAQFIPVIAPFGFSIDEDTLIFNINADNVAANLAASLQVEACVFLTDVPGVLDSQKNIIPRMNPQQAHELMRTGVISGGMIPKIEAALKALEGSKMVFVLDGKVPHVLYQAAAENKPVGTTFINI